jgi:hypothetical protein
MDAYDQKKTQRDNRSEAIYAAITLIEACERITVQRETSPIRCSEPPEVIVAAALQY